MDPSRRAFLGRAAGASGIALATPWWGPWLRKFFGPSGHIHDMKVRTYQSQPLNWDAEHRMLTAEEVEEQTRDRKRRFEGYGDETTLMISRSNGRFDLPFTNRAPATPSIDALYREAVYREAAAADREFGPEPEYFPPLIDFTLTQPVTSINVARPDQKQLELKVAALWDGLDSKISSMTTLSQMITYR